MASRYTLARKKGELPAGTYRLFLSVEWLDDPAKQEATVRHLLEGAPQFAPAWRALAVMSEGENEQLHAVEQGLAARPICGTLASAAAGPHLQPG